MSSNTKFLDKFCQSFTIDQARFPRSPSHFWINLRRALQLKLTNVIAAILHE